MWITEKEQGRVIKNKGDEFCWKKLKHEKFIEAVRKWQMLLASKVKISGIEKTKANMNSRNKIFGKHIDNSANLFFWLIRKKKVCKQLIRNVTMVLTCRKIFGWLLSRNVQILFVFHQRILHWEIAIKEFFLVYDTCV